MSDQVERDPSNEFDVIEINLCGTSDDSLASPIPHKRIMFIIGTKLVFVNYDVSTPIEAFNDALPMGRISHVVSSDSHGDTASLLLPLAFGDEATKRIWLGDYYPYIPMYIKYRMKDRKDEVIKVVEMVKRNVDETTEALQSIREQGNPNNILLYGNHDPSSFPLVYTETINGKTFTFQHGIENRLGEAKVIKHYYDKTERDWLLEAESVLGASGERKPFYTCFNEPSVDLDIPSTDYVIVGHLSNYKLPSFNKTLFTTDACNSSFMLELKAIADEARRKRYEQRQLMLKQNDKL